MADGRQTQSDDKTTHGLWSGELKQYYDKNYNNMQTAKTVMPLTDISNLFIGV